MSANVFPHIRTIIRHRREFGLLAVVANHAYERALENIRVLGFSAEAFAILA